MSERGSHNCAGIVKLVSRGVAASMFLATIHDAIAQQRLSYEPAQVKLSRTVTLEQHYGPPNYGEDPSTDEKVIVPVIKLDKPVDVISNTQSGPDQESFFSIQKMQLVILDDQPINNRVGQHVTVRGELFEKEDGHHYTDVLIQVTSRILPFKSAS